MTEKKLQIVLADDNQFFCEALKDSLQKHEEFNVIAFFTSIIELIDFTNSNSFDLLVLDINFNGESSLDFLDKIKPESANFKIISLTTLNNNFIQSEALKKGVNYFIGKDSDLRNFKKIILDCMVNEESGNNTFSKKIQIDNLIFTQRKLEILQNLYIHSDKKEEEISKLLNISVSALKTHKRELFEITNSSNTIELIKFGIQNGLIIA